MAFEWTDEQIQLFIDALLDAFRDMGSLRLFAQTRLSVNLDTEVRQGGTLRDVVFELIQWARSRGALPGLLEAARRAKPENPELERFELIMSPGAARGLATLILSPYLVQRLFDTLSALPEFTSDETLQRVFDDLELRSLQARLPRAPDREERAQKVIEYLLPSFLGGGGSALPAFLRVLARANAQALAGPNSLESLAAELQVPLEDHPGHDVYFVIAAMQADEAQDLFNGRVGQERFPPVWKALQEQQIDNLLTGYGARREDWRPPFHAEMTIRDLVVDTVNRLNRGNLARRNSRLMRPLFRSAEFFEESERRVAFWRFLKKPETVAVLIIDAVSLFHPAVSSLLSRSGMITQESGAVLVFAPMNHRLMLARRLIEQELAQQWEVAFDRFAADFDRRCEMGVLDGRSLQRWLYAILPDAIAQLDRPVRENVELIRQVGTRSGFGEFLYPHNPQRGAA